MAFSVINKLPGVYIQEVLTAGPIPGVATSVAAIVGPSRFGPSATPTLVTNPTQFNSQFDLVDEDQPPSSLTARSVHGYFQNGGQLCYFVRVSNGVFASLPLLDQAGAPVITVRALTEGSIANGVTVQVADASIANTEVVRATADTTALAAAANQLAVPTANFRPGDRVRVATPAPGFGVVARILDANTLELEADLAAPVAANIAVSIADLPANARTFRVADSAGIETGSALRVTADGAPSIDRMVARVDRTSHFVTLADPLGAVVSLDPGNANPTTAVTLEFQLTITEPGTPAVVHGPLSVDNRHSQYYETAFSSEVVELLAAEPPNTTAPPANRPVALAPAVALGTGTAGVDDALPHTLADYQRALSALEEVDAVTIVCTPDDQSVAVQNATLTHCEEMADRFAVLDVPRGQDRAGAEAHRAALQATDRGFGALYYPWLEIPDPHATAPPGGEVPRIQVPPCGFVAGVYARTDEEQGVHKAPANESIRGIVGVEAELTPEDGGLLNEQSVNLIRPTVRGFRIWGARTLSTTVQWRYVNVRRLLLFIEESIQEGTEQFVFAPNTPALWETVKRQVVDFLTRVQKDGALFGSKPEQGFEVRVDEELNPPSTIALGQLVLQVRLRPSTPAEFIVFRIIQDPARAIVEE